MRLVWHEDAVKDLICLRRFIASDKPSAAKKTAAAIKMAVGLIRSNPRLGRPGRVHGTRELVIPGLPYIVPYRVSGNEVQILRVYHQAMQWPEEFD